MKIFLFLVTLSFATSTFANSLYVCSAPQINLKTKILVQGVGTAAVISLSDATMTGTNFKYTGPGPSPGPTAGYMMFTGTVVSKFDNPPNPMQVPFFFSPTLANGTPTGSYLRMGNDTFITFNCTKIK